MVCRASAELCTEDRLLPTRGPIHSSCDSSVNNAQSFTQGLAAALNYKVTVFSDRPFLEVIRERKWISTMLFLTIFFYDRHFVELSFKVESLMQNYLNHIWVWHNILLTSSQVHLEICFCSKQNEWQQRSETCYFIKSDNLFSEHNGRGSWENTLALS